MLYRQHKRLARKSPIPEFDPRNRRHVAIAKAGEAAVQGAALQPERLRQERDKVTVTVARRELRKWLRELKEWKGVERVVERWVLREFINSVRTL